MINTGAALGIQEELYSSRCYKIESYGCVGDGLGRSEAAALGTELAGSMWMDYSNLRTLFLQAQGYRRSNLMPEYIGTILISSRPIPSGYSFKVEVILLEIRRPSVCKRLGKSHDAYFVTLRWPGSESRTEASISGKRFDLTQGIYHVASVWAPCQGPFWEQ
jgi:hypothetical protein